MTKKIRVNIPSIYPVSGVIRAALFEGVYNFSYYGAKPISERLIYINPIEAIHFDIISSKENYTPKNVVELSIKSFNSKNMGMI